MANERILVIDDNSMNLKLMRVLLSGAGYEIQTAKDAEDALAVLESFEPRLILMDLQLPKMSGLELTRTLKSDPRYKNTIVVAVTAYAMKGDDQKAFAAGCDGYLSKPIDTRRLPGILNEYLGAPAR